MILTWPRDPSRWNWSKTQFSACPIFQCQIYLPGSFVSTVSRALSTHHNDYRPPHADVCCRSIPVSSFCTISYSSLYLYTSTKWIPTRRHTRTLVLHFLLPIAPLLPFNPRRGQQSRGWGACWCSSFPSRGSQLQHTCSYLCSSRVENLDWSILNRERSKGTGSGGYAWLEQPVMPLIQCFPLDTYSNFEYAFPFSNWTVAWTQNFAPTITLTFSKPLISYLVFHIITLSVKACYFPCYIFGNGVAIMGWK